MELRLNLATCSLKDAEHAIFIIGAYFGMTALPHVGAPVLSANGHFAGGSHSLTDPGVSHGTPQPQAAHVVTPPVVPVAPTLGAEPQPVGYVEQDENPAAAFAAPPALPPEVVFAGNGATAPAGAPALPVAPPSATPAAAPAAGDAGNVAGAVVAPAGSPLPVMPAPGPSPSVASVELDADGLPWDPRICAAGEGGAKPKNADGRWRKKRGLNDAAFIAQVQAELRATLAAPVAPPLPPVAQVPTPPPPAAVQPSAPPSADPATFEQLMPRVTKAITDKVLPLDALQQATAAYGLSTVVSLAQRPDLVPSVWLYLRTQYPAL